jgi:23S rRNA pseudouridine1911/1915/1917 synthase
MISAGELQEWILHEDDRLLAVDKPGDVVCHPSKHGPWSSLVGAVREHTGLDAVHLVFRLDRETSGVVVLAKDPAMARRMQMAMQERRVGKTYVALLTGELGGEVAVEQPLGDDTTSPVFMKSAVRPDGRPSLTRFEPLSRAGGFTLARVTTGTGRKHQIRAHAQWLGHSVVGDKIYGPDSRLYLDFIDRGWSPQLEALLYLPRQGLHCARIDLGPAGLPLAFSAPLPGDMRAFCEAHGLDTSRAADSPKATPGASGADELDGGPQGGP